MKLKYKITGLDCANCANELENTLKKVDGVCDVSINFMSQRLLIEIDKDQEETMKNVKKLIKKVEPDVEIKEL